MSMTTQNSIPGASRDSNNRAKRSAQSVSNPDSPDYDINDPEYDESLDDSRGNSIHLKNRPKNRSALGLDAPEISDTIATDVDDSEENAIQDGTVSTISKVGGLGSAALGYGGDLASNNPGAVRIVPAKGNFGK
jgi:hypothetical protein